MNVSYDVKLALLERYIAEGEQEIKAIDDKKSLLAEKTAQIALLSEEVESLSHEIAESKVDETNATLQVLYALVEELKAPVEIAEQPKVEEQHEEQAKIEEQPAAEGEIAQEEQPAVEIEAAPSEEGKPVQQFFQI